MTKAELIKAFREAAQVQQAEAEEYLARLGDIVAAELLADGEVPLPGLGKLAVKKSAARKGRNPRTGAAIDIPASRKVVVKLAKDFKESFK